MGRKRPPLAAEPEEYSIEPADWLELTEECHHYEGRHEVPWDIQKYFSQRYSIFSLYDEGVCMTDDAWFGVTPEPIAHKIVSEVPANDSISVVIDVFCGAGGNSIAFALSERWDRVISIERDAATLACAQNNAEVYGVDPEKITWIHGDSFDYMDRLLNRPETLHPDLRVDLASALLFSSPPWGGPGYSTDEVFNLNNMQPYNLDKLHQAYKHLDHVLYLPRTSDLRQLARLAPEGEKIELVQYCMQGASKALVAYIPRLNT